MFDKLCAGIGLFVLVVLGFTFVTLLIINMIDWLVDKCFKCTCTHEWELYDCCDCDDYWTSNYIELQCKKCGEIKRIECDIDKTKWDIEYKHIEYKHRIRLQKQKEKNK